MKKLDRWGLGTILEQQKALLRIQTTKLREARKAALRRREREGLERRGPKWVGRPQPQQQRQQLSKDQCKELHQFWKDIWGREGTCDPKHPVMAEWMAEMRSQTEPQEDDVALPDGEEVWRAALGKVTSWKAPGPDGLRGYWLGAFPSARNLLEGMLWEVLAGEEVPPSGKGQNLHDPKGRM